VCMFVCLRDYNTKKKYPPPKKVLIAVNNHACNVWIVNGITDCNTFLFQIFFFHSISE